MRLLRPYSGEGSTLSNLLNLAGSALAINTSNINWFFLLQPLPSPRSGAHAMSRPSEARCLAVCRLPLLGCLLSLCSPSIFRFGGLHPNGGLTMYVFLLVQPCPPVKSNHSQLTWALDAPCVS